MKYKCQHCGIDFKRAGKGHKFCSRRCCDLAHRGSAHYNWKGGRWAPNNPKSYVHLSDPDHPHGQVHEHVVLAERALGKPLPKQAEVHHMDENPQNNAPGNLVICQDHAYHMLLQRRARRLKDTGSLDLKRCSLCYQVKSLEAFGSRSNREFGKGKTAECKDCYNARQNRRRAMSRVQL